MAREEKKVCYLIVNRLPEGKTKEGERIANSFLSQSSGCLGCQTYHKLTSSLEKPLKGKNLHASKAGTSEDFLTTSTFEMEDDKVESRGSISPISKPTQMHDAPGAGCSNNPSDFINHGLLLWYQIRQNWIKNKKPLKHSQQLREPRIQKWWIFWLTFGSRRECTIEKPQAGEFAVSIWYAELRIGLESRVLSLTKCASNTNSR